MSNQAMSEVEPPTVGGMSEAFCRRKGLLPLQDFCRMKGYIHSYGEELVPISSSKQVEATCRYSHTSEKFHLELNIFAVLSQCFLFRQVHGMPLMWPAGVVDRSLVDWYLRVQ